VILIHFLVPSQKKSTVHSDLTIYICLSILMDILLLTVVLEVLDDKDFSVREVALSLISISL